MKYAFAGALAALSFAATSAEAAKIISPVSVRVASGGSAGSFWAVGNVINQSGLPTKYTPGSTDFDAYVAQNVQVNAGLNTEWFSAQSSRAAQLVFDFGQEVTIYKLALWDENNSGQQSMSISTPELGLVRTFRPTESAQERYGPQAFEFRPITTRYLTLDIIGCGRNGAPSQSVDYCGLGEIIFADGSGIAVGVPEPATWAMMILGFGGVGATLRRRRASAAFA
ncbi:MAG: PEPxxWA-CTERM sorting domain-containing protein [Pseudomonadota bacterium]